MSRTAVPCSVYATTNTRLGADAPIITNRRSEEEWSTSGYVVDLVVALDAVSGVAPQSLMTAAVGSREMGIVVLPFDNMSNDRAEVFVEAADLYRSARRAA